jgi:membrane fusion protein (multidrug efflux system)
MSVAPHVHPDAASDARHDAPATITRAEPGHDATPLTAAANPARRRQRLIALAAGVVVAGASWAAYAHFVASHHVSTDNAYTAAEVATITPAASGIVSAVDVVDTQAVRAGDVLLRLDDTDARLALAQADAEVSRAERRVRGYLANDAGLRAQVDAREAAQRQAAAQLQVAQADLARAKLDFARREALAHTGSVSGEELSNARTALDTAQAQLAAAQSAAAQAQANRVATQGALSANEALTAHAGVDDNPEVVLARARRDQARVDLERTTVRAPIDGVIARRQIQAGQRIQAGTAVMSIVPTAQVHVDANFKEGQLTDVRPGQRAELVADLYGDQVVYHGVVSGLSGGTGSAFAAIPAQNATGNWIKVVQRVPVRITLDPKELAARPLAVGLSMNVTIDTRSGDAAKQVAQH